MPAVIYLAAIWIATAIIIAIAALDAFNRNENQY